MKPDPLQLLQPYTIDLFHLKDSPCHVSRMDPVELLLPNRLDLAAKLLYIDHYVNEYDMAYATDVYARHIEAFSPYCSEPGQPEKDSVGKFLDTFHQLIESFKNEGFQSGRSLVPLGKNNVMLDGSHRVSCAIYFGKLINVAVFPDVECTWNIDFVHFRNCSLAENALDAMTLEYSRWKTALHMVCLWPRASCPEKRSLAEGYIREQVRIVHKKEIPLSDNALHLLMCQIYGTFGWIGSTKDLFSGVRTKVDACFGNGKTQFYLVEGGTAEDILRLKERIRALFSMGKHSVHASDSIEEARMISDLVFNRNSLHFLHKARPFRFPESHDRFAAFRDELRSTGMGTNDVIVDGSQVMAMYGLREAGDLDYLIRDGISDEGLPSAMNLLGVENHAPHLRFHDRTVAELVRNPDHHFTFQGVKFVSLPQLIKYKTNRGEEKDRVDIRMIKACLRFDRMSWRFKWAESMNACMRMRRRFALLWKHYSWAVGHAFRTYTPRYTAACVLRRIGLHSQAKKLYWNVCARFGIHPPHNDEPDPWSSPDRSDQ